MDPITSEIQLCHHIPTSSDHIPFEFTISLPQPLEHMNTINVKLYDKADYSNIVRPHLQASFENFIIDKSTDTTIQQSFDDFDQIISSNLALIPEKTIKEKYLAKWWTKELSAKRQDYNKSRAQLNKKLIFAKRRKNILRNKLRL